MSIILTILWWFALAVIVAILLVGISIWRDGDAEGKSMVFGAVLTLAIFAHSHWNSKQQDEIDALQEQVSALCAVVGECQ